ncbi:MAG: putative Multi-sensor hybrid histidine kinase [Verrucomicrobiales bacterium]|nr:putative Multi-sensor hybrid histidine kinase [Verrucomicrobiales bacterium]
MGRAAARLVLQSHGMSTTDQISLQQEAMLAWIQEFAPYGVITTDSELRIRTWNHWMEAHSGLVAESAIGQKLLELYPDLIERRLAGRFHRALMGEVNVLATGLHGYLLPLAPSIPESGYRHMLQTARIAPLVLGQQINGIIVVIEDVTQREFQAAVLGHQHDRDKILSWALAHLLKAKDPRRIIRELFFKVAEHLDFDTYFLYLSNDRGESIKLHAAGGISPDVENLLSTSAAREAFYNLGSDSGKSLAIEHIQSTTGDHLRIPREIGIHAYALLSLIEGDRKIGTLCFATRSRETISSEELDLLSTIAEYLAVALNREFTDLALRDAQQALSEHAQELEKKVAERTSKLKEIIAELETFSYTVAHDLRAPIRALTGYCEILVEDYSAALPAEANSVISRLSRACRRLDVLTRDLLQFSKISRQEIELTPVEIHQVLAEVIALAPPLLRDSLIIQDPLHDVLAQRTLLQQCLSNIMENALKFVETGMKPHITVRTELVDASAIPQSHPLPFNPARYGVSTADSGSSADEVSSETVPEGNLPRVRIWIEDRGVGIPAEAHQKVFGIFERGANYERYEGTGIGLAIVARAMQRMGGACGVESEPGAGSRFWLEFAQP